MPASGGSVPPEHQRVLGKAALSQSRALRELGGAVVHRSILHVVRRALGARTHFAGSMLAAQA